MDVQDEVNYSLCHPFAATFKKRTCDVIHTTHFKDLKLSNIRFGRPYFEGCY